MYITGWITLSVVVLSTDFLGFSPNQKLLEDSRHKSKFIDYPERWAIYTIEMENFFSWQPAAIWRLLMLIPRGV